MEGWVGLGVGYTCNKVVYLSANSLILATRTWQQPNHQSNSWPFNHKSDVLPITLPNHPTTTSHTIIVVVWHGRFMHDFRRVKFVFVGRSRDNHLSHLTQDLNYWDKAKLFGYWQSRLASLQQQPFYQLNSLALNTKISSSSFSLFYQENKYEAAIRYLHLALLCTVAIASWNYIFLVSMSCFILSIHFFGCLPWFFLPYTGIPINNNYTVKDLRQYKTKQLRADWPVYNSSNTINPIINQLLQVITRKAQLTQKGMHNHDACLRAQ